MRFKKKLQTVMLTEEEMGFIADLFTAAEDEESDDEADFVDNDMDSEPDNGYGITLSGDSQIEERLSNSAFDHSEPTTNDRKSMVMCMYSHLGAKPDLDFMGVRIDTGANRRSIMSTGQYRSYCATFGLSPRVRQPDGRSISSMGGNQKAVAFALIHVPFCDLGILIDV